MKKWFFALMAALLITGAATGCSNDDDLDDTNTEETEEMEDTGTEEGTEEETE
ncbi:hypothetical protein [Bacillus sp. FJAT-27251]|uniref:hypothetical protein n=1 Tax=Bacillus sp. FJAT-27251 TaxID=1684142 RepID=UPI000B04F246|nr:hypothetical protein [Bacillus sp. FJAT-27251]